MCNYKKLHPLFSSRQQSFSVPSVKHKINNCQEQSIKQPHLLVFIASCVSGAVTRLIHHMQTGRKLLWLRKTGSSTQQGHTFVWESLLKGAIKSTWLQGWTSVTAEATLHAPTSCTLANKLTQMHCVTLCLFYC